MKELPFQLDLRRRAKKGEITRIQVVISAILMIFDGLIMICSFTLVHSFLDHWYSFRLLKAQLKERPCADTEECGCSKEK